MGDLATLHGGSSELMVGVELHRLQPHEDERGILTEFHRNVWPQCRNLRQFNYVSATANSLRGVHVHPVHTDYLLVVSGCMLLALADIRKDSVDYLKSCTLLLKAADFQAVSVPPGVAHGFYFAEESSFIQGVDEYWSPEDELCCAWDDPLLNIDWPCSNPVISPRDRDGAAAEAMIEQFAARHQSGGAG